MRRGFTYEAATDDLLFHRRTLTVMPGRVLNINLSKIKVNLKRKFEFLKPRLLFRHLLSLKLNLTVKYQLLRWISRICSVLGGRPLHEMTDCAALWVALCKVNPPGSWAMILNIPLVFILGNIIRLLPRVPFPRLRKDPFVLVYYLYL